MAHYTAYLNLFHVTLAEEGHEKVLSYCHFCHYLSTFLPHPSHTIFPSSSISLSIQWLPQIVFVAYRICLAIYILSWLIVHAIQSQETDPPTGAKYLIYVTQWSYIILSFNYLCWASLVTIYTIIAHFFRKSLKQALPKSHTHMQPSEYYRQDKTPWFVKVMWAIHVVAVAASLPVTVVYWASVFNPENGATAASIHVHGINLLLVLVDIFVSRIPILLFHFFYPMAYAAVYVIFLAVYWAANGTNELEEPYVYSITDFGGSPIYASVTCIALVLLAGVIHLLFFAVAEIRDQIYKRVRFCFWNIQETGVMGTTLTTAYELGPMAHSL